MQNASKLPLLLFALFICGLVTACNRNSPPHSDQPLRSPQGSGSFHATYQPNVHVVERDMGIHALKGVSTDGSTLVFDASDPALQSLKAGDVLLVKGLLARKVLAVQPQGSDVTLLTVPASFREVLQKGSLQVSAPVHFGPVQSAHQSMPAFPLWQDVSSWLSPTVYAQSPEGEALSKMEAKGGRDAFGNMALCAIDGLVNGWEAAFSATSAAGRLNINITLKKNVGGFEALITGKGYLADFDFSSDINLGDNPNQSTVDKIQTQYKQVNGVMNFTWEVAKKTPGVLTNEKERIKLPAAVEIPLYEYLDGFPLFLEVSSALIIEPAISGGQEYSRGAFRITFDGTQNFQVKKGNIDADGNVTGDIQFVEGQNISPVIPMGMVVAFAAPRIELTLGVGPMFGIYDVPCPSDRSGKTTMMAMKAVDALENAFLKAIAGTEAYDKFKQSPFGGVSAGQAFTNLVKSSAAAYMEMVASSGMSNTGASAITPCTRTDLHLLVKVGTHAEAFGFQAGSAEKDIFKKDFTRIDPPGTHLCESVGPPAGG